MKPLHVLEQVHPLVVVVLKLILRLVKTGQFEEDELELVMQELTGHVFAKAVGGMVSSLVPSGTMLHAEVHDSDEPDGFEAEVPPEASLEQKSRELSVYGKMKRLILKKTASCMNESPFLIMDLLKIGYKIPVSLPT